MSGPDELLACDLQFKVRQTVAALRSRTWWVTEKEAARDDDGKGYKSSARRPSVVPTVAADMLESLIAANAALAARCVPREPTEAMQDAMRYAVWVEDSPGLKRKEMLLMMRKAWRAGFDAYAGKNADEITSMDALAARCEKAELALQFYAKHIHWMALTSDADASQKLLIANGDTDGTDGWCVAEQALASQAEGERG